MGTALLLGAAAPAHELAHAALLAAGWRVIDAGDTAVDSGASPVAGFEALAAAGAPHLVVFVAAPAAADAPLAGLAPAALRTLEAALLVEPWQALRSAALRLEAPGASVLLVADVAGRPGERGAFTAAAQRALRTMIAAAAVEFAGRAAPLRVNLLEYDAGALEPEAFAAALAFLAGPGASFMTGTQLALPARAPGVAMPGAAAAGAARVAATGAARQAAAEPATLTHAAGAGDGGAGDGTLAGKVIAITGATSGIGRASALACARAGATVLVTGRNVARGESVVAQLREAGGRAEYLRQDVTQEEDWRRVVATIAERHGRLDALVNNAGESLNKPIAELTREDFWFLLRINVEACHLGMRSCLPLLAASGGAILNVSSVAALRGGPGGTIYGPSKAAMSGMSAAVAAEVARSAPGVRVNALHPGFIWGEGPVESLGEEGARQFRERIVARTPLRRVGEVEDVAASIAFLLCDAARGISGQDLVVDGGLALSFP